MDGIGLNNEVVTVYTNKDQKLTNYYPIIQPQQLKRSLPETCSEVMPQPNSGCPEERQCSPIFQENHQSNSFSRDVNPSNPLYQAGNQANPHYQEEHQSNLHCKAGHPHNPLNQGGTKGGVKDAPQTNNHNSRITISLVTPLRLRFEGNITDSIEFHVLIRNLLRRISSLSYFHCDEKLELDFKGIIERAKAVKQTASDIKWFDWKRYSTRQEEWMSLGGVVGAVSYEGALTEFMQLLRLGEYIHVGKGTSFGLGKYEIM